MTDNSQDIEAALVASAANKDSNAMRRIYELYAPMVVGVCRRYVQRQDDVDDMVQNVFVKVYLNIGQFVYCGQGSLSAWIRKIAVNEAVRSIRQSTMYIDITEVGDIPDTQPPDTERLSTAQILECVLALPTIYRTIFNLYVIDGRSHKEIAQMLDIDTRTSATRLSRAKKLLANIINDKYGYIR